MQTTELVNYLDNLLHVKTISDKSVNGLQVGHAGNTVIKVAFAVDACLDTFQGAAAGKAQLLCVHHGMFWGTSIPITGAMFDRIQFLLAHDLALYAVHLPLDAHPEFGHNAQMAKLLGLQEMQPFGDYHGQMLGFMGKLPQPLEFSAFCAQFETINQGPLLPLAFGKKIVSTVGIVSGGAADICKEAIDKNIDVYITGETHHGSYHVIKEGQLNVIFAGHYHSEKFGLLALAEHLEQKFGLVTTFIKAPTGL